MVLQQKLLEKADFIVKITGLVMVLPASSDKWKALCVVKQQPQEQQQKSHQQDILQRHLQIDRSIFASYGTEAEPLRLCGFLCVGDTGRRGNKITGVPDRIGIYKCWFLKRWENEVPGEKALGARKRTNNNLNPHMATKSGFEPGPHWWEASTPHHCPPLPWWRTPYNWPYGDAPLRLIGVPFAGVRYIEE